MKRVLLFALIGVLVIIGGYGSVVSFSCTKCESLRDRLAYAVFMMDDDTRFSPRYDEESFRKIIPGMSKSDVVELLGEPLKKDKTGTRNYSEVWRFSEADPDRNYWFRVVLFDAQGKVVRREAKYFVD
jgi:outer membrane protein assembly factor BamE (lipoprotein component of BamABCDE complex)